MFHLSSIHTKDQFTLHWWTQKWYLDDPICFLLERHAVLHQLWFSVWGHMMYHCCMSHWCYCYYILVNSMIISNGMMVQKNGKAYCIINRHDPLKPANYTPTQQHDPSDRLIAITVKSNQLLVNSVVPFLSARQWDVIPQENWDPF
jgi:hypothetical protein